MTYYISKTVPRPFAEAVGSAEAALRDEGFGIISRIDIQGALKEKIGVDFRPYVILGACNPSLAYQALQLEDKVGTMLPCNVVVQELEAGRSEVAAIDPVVSMQAIGNPALQEKARLVRQKLASAIARL